MPGDQINCWLCQKLTLATTRRKQQQQKLATVANIQRLTNKWYIKETPFKEKKLLDIEDFLDFFVI